VNENQRNQYRGKKKENFQSPVKFSSEFQDMFAVSHLLGKVGVEINATKIIEVGFGDSMGDIYLCFIHEDVVMMNKNCSQAFRIR